MAPGSRNLASWAAAAIVLAALALLARHAQPPARDASQYADAIQQAAAAADKRNADAEGAVNAAFEASWSARIKALRAAAAVTAADLGSYHSAMRFAWLAMKDKVQGTSQAEQRLRARFEAALAEDTRLLAADMARGVSLYGVALSESTAALAHDLGQPNPGALPPPPPPEIRARSASAQEELDRLAIQGMVLPLDLAGAPAGAGALANLAQRGSATASRLFARAVTAETTGAVLAVADGPLPLGDILAAGLLAWSSVEIYKARSAWAEAMRQEGQRLVDEIAQTARTSTLKRIDVARSAELARQQAILDAASKEAAW